MKVNNQ